MIKRGQGWSAFAGFIMIPAGVPLNNFLAERHTRIFKAIRNAKDKRMGEVNELLGAVTCSSLLSRTLLMAYRSSL
jgi:hypothetical protein